MSNAGKTVVEGTFGATGVSAAIPIHGEGSILIDGGIGTVQVERSYDEGVTYQIASINSAGDQAIYTTTAGTGLNAVIEEPEPGILYRLNCTAYTSDIDYRLVAMLGNG